MLVISDACVISLTMSWILCISLKRKDGLLVFGVHVARGLLKMTDLVIAWMRVFAVAGWAVLAFVLPFVLLHFVIKFW